MTTPTATYRVQLNPNFNFKALQHILPYLAQLGISHIYASPIFEAKQGSPHGYDITNPNQISTQLGGQEAFERLIEAASALGLEWMQDIVPNHQAYTPQNPAIWDLMQKSTKSRFQEFFDVDCGHPAPRLKNKILAPFLAEPYWDCLKKHLLALAEDGAQIRYGSLVFPLAKPVSPDHVARYSDPTLMNKLLRNQPYRLAYWRDALVEINYRRFFDITDLIGVRVEESNVFEATHRLIFQLATAGKFSALRVDHIDGLYSPEAYLKRLREKFPNLYLVVEKILTGEEQLQVSWQVQGSTGYDFIAHVNSLFIDSGSQQQISQFYRDFTGNMRDFGEVLYECKKLVLESYFLGDVKNLTRLFSETLQKTGYTKAFSAAALQGAVIELMTCFPIYRTYNTPKTHDFAPFTQALETAEKKNPKLSPEFAALAFLLEQTPRRPEALHAVMRLQQFTGAVMAKGLEDTAFYRFVRFISANEVGGDPAGFGCTNAEFHNFIWHRQRNWPFSLNATSTHDTKRGEDVRARLNVLSEVPAEFQRRVLEWAALNVSKKPHVNGKPAPDPNEEYYLYQILVGAYPFDLGERQEFVGRLKQHMTKALREAKQNSNWLTPNQPYEQAVSAFAEEILDSPCFLDSFLPFQEKIAFYGTFNSLSHTLLKVACPGVPDFYQGTELWNLSMVDPDNRRPVNYQTRQKLLQEIANLPPKNAPRLLANYADAKAKLYMIYRLLKQRCQHKALFDGGAYVPLSIAGRRRGNVFAFIRKKGNLAVIAVVPKFTVSIIDAHAPWSSVDWVDTYITLPSAEPSNWTDIFSDKTIRAEADGLRVGKILSDFPVALLLGGSTVG